MGKGFKQIGKRRDWGGECSGEIKYVGEYSPRDDRVSRRVKDCSDTGLWLMPVQYERKA
jgi:hypothetical protein